MASRPKENLLSVSGFCRLGFSQDLSVPNSFAIDKGVGMTSMVSIIG
jgi:hypothetical protein